LNPHDISEIRLASDVRLSPDARRVAFVVSEPAESGQAARRSGIWTVAADGSEIPRLRISGGDDNSPRWSPDGTTLAFLSVRGEGPAGTGGSTRQAYRVAAKEDGAGAPERLTSADGGVDEFGVEAEMVVYPREGHPIRERAHQEDLQNRVLAWFDRHLKEPVGSE
jgi:dipeptidyl aminopeptidase/acylaminoacyl peptidase